jgi:hypothetical protein
MCDVTGICNPIVCQPSCDDRQCGYDGCGGSCGECSERCVCVDFGCECAPFAAGKFCNGLIDSEVGEFLSRIEIGDGSDQVSMEALSNRCNTPIGEACVDLPLGSNVPVTLFLSEEYYGTYEVSSIDDGDSIIFILELDSGGLPTLGLYEPTEGSDCASVGLSSSE